MKRIFSIVLSLIVLTCLFNFNVFAANDSDMVQNVIVISETTEYFEDGSSIITTITQHVNQNQTRATRTVSGSKTRTVKNADGVVLYKFKINGTFSVNEGVSATCTAVSCSASDCSNGWSLDSSTTSKSGNTASAVGVFKKKTLFITTQTVETPISLSCDANGTLS